MSNQAIRAASHESQKRGSDTPAIDIGHGKFHEAVQAWRALAPADSPALQPTVASATPTHPPSP